MATFFLRSSAAICLSLSSCSFFFRSSSALILRKRSILARRFFRSTSLRLLSAAFFFLSSSACFRLRSASSCFSFSFFAFKRLIFLSIFFWRSLRSLSFSFSRLRHSISSCRFFSSSSLRLRLGSYLEGIWVLISIGAAYAISIGPSPKSAPRASPPSTDERTPSMTSCTIFCVSGHSFLVFFSKPSGIGTFGSLRRASLSFSSLPRIFSALALNRGAGGFHNVDGV